MLRTAIVALVLLVAAPAQAHTGPNASTRTLSATPCGPVCYAYEYGAASPCATPPPPGTYVDVLLGAAPTPPAGKVVVLEATLDMVLGGWDLYTCPEASRPAPNILGEPCDNIVGPNNLLPVGCHEDYSWPVAAGQTAHLRAVNVADVDAVLTTWFTIV